MDALSGVSPRYLSATNSTNCILSLKIQCNGQLCILLQVFQLVGGGLPSLWGYLNIYQLLHQFHVTSITQSELSFLTSLKAWGNAEESCSDIAFLLVSTEEGAAGDRMYGLSMVWVNPHQARVPTVEEAVKQLTALVTSGPNWPYALVLLNRDTCHVPLSREGHLGILPKGDASRTASRRVSQLEVCQLLHLDLQVIYPAGLSGHKIPLVTPLSESLANGINLPGCECIYLKVDILQSIMEGPEWKALPPGNCPSILMVSPVKAVYSQRAKAVVNCAKAEREVSMTMEVRELLSRAVLEMSGHVSENSTPKRLNPTVILTPLPCELGDPSGPVDT